MKLRSEVNRTGADNGLCRSLYKAMGYSDEELTDRPVIGIANSWSTLVPGHYNLRLLADFVRKGIYRAGGTAVEFGTISCCDGIANGHEGMKYILPAREVVCDSVEIAAQAHRLDALVLLASCDKILPGMLMAAARLDIPAKIVDGNIFKAVESVPSNPCSLCAKMRRGTLYRIARDELKCNKIALGHHYDDVIVTTLMNLLNSGSFQTMLPKLKAKNYKPMQLIRPMYFIRESDIRAFGKRIGMEFIACACPLTEKGEGLAERSMRQATKELIARLIKEYSPYVERSLFACAGNVKMNAILGWRLDGVKHSYLEYYDSEEEPEIPARASADKEKD